MRKLSCNVTLALYAFDLLELDGEDLRAGRVRDPQGDARQPAALLLAGAAVE